MVKEILEKEVLTIIKEIFPEADISGVSVDVSDNFGDYATNAAMVLSKRVGKSPRDVAGELIKALEKEKVNLVEKIEVAGPGFINFYIADKFFIDNVAEILKEGHGIGKNEKEKERKVMIEYTDPNPFKVFHIGHLMTNAIGESLARLYEFGGAEVKRANYQGDIGLHVAKALWGMKQTLDEMPKDSATLTEKTAYLGKAYSFGSDAYGDEENTKAQEEIKEINKQIYESSCDKQLRELYDKGRQWSFDHFEVLYKKLGTKFDHYFFESQTFVEGTQLVKDNLKKGIFEKSDGAVIFPGSKYGLHDRVFLNSQGLPTYEAKDLGLTYLKYKTYKADLSLVITASEQTEYFKVIIEAMKQINPDIAKHMAHIGHGMMRATTGKMSSRKGNVITGESIVNNLIEMARKKISIEGINENEKENIATIIGVAAIKFSILRHQIGKDIVFDPEKSISFEGDSGPYVQYANARAQSILRKAEEKGIELNAKDYTGSVTDIEKILQRFPSVVERAAREQAPHFMCTYLLELASAFNSFYANTPILNSGDVASYRVALTRAVSQVLKNGLYVLGITAPERM